MKKGTKQGTLTKLLGRKHSPPSLFTPTPMGVSPLNSGATDIQDYDKILKMTSQVNDHRYNPSADSGTARVKSRPTVKLITHSSSNIFSESQGLNVPTPSIPDSIRNYPAGNNDTANDRVANGNLKHTVGEYFHQNTLPSSYADGLIIPPPPMEPPPPPPQMPPPPPPPMDRPSPPAFSPPKPPSKTVSNQQPVFSYDHSVPPLNSPPNVPPPPPPSAAPAKSILGMSALSKSSLTVETPASTWRLPNGQLPPPDQCVNPSGFKPPPPPPKHSALLPPQPVLPKSSKVPPPKPIRYSSMQNLDKLTESSNQASGLDTQSLYELELQQPHEKSTILSSFNPSNEAKLYVPSASENKSISDRQLKTKSLIIMEDFTGEEYNKSKQNVDHSIESTMTKSGPSEVQTLRFDNTTPQKPVRKNGPQYQINASDVLNTSSDSHLRSTNVWDYRNKEQPDTSKNAMSRHKDTSAVSFTQVPSSQAADYAQVSRVPDVRGSSVNASALRSLEKTVPKTADMDDGNEPAELIHPITGLKLDPDSPMGLLLTAKHRALKEAESNTPHNQSSLDIPSMGRPEPSSVNFYYNDSKPSSVTVIAKAQQHNYSVDSESLPDGPGKKNPSSVSKIPEMGKNIRSAGFTYSPDATTVLMDSHRKMEERQTSSKTEKLSASQLIQSILSKHSTATLEKENETDMSTYAFSVPPPAQFSNRYEDRGEEFSFEPIPPPPEFAGDSVESSIPSKDDRKEVADTVLLRKSPIFNYSGSKQEGSCEPNYLKTKHSEPKGYSASSNQNEISSRSAYSIKPSNLLQSSNKISEKPYSVTIKPKSTSQNVYPRDHGKGLTSHFSSSAYSSSSGFEQHNQCVPQINSLDNKPSYQHTPVVSASNVMASKGPTTSAPASKESQRSQQNKNQQTFGRTFLIRPGNKQPITVLDPGTQE